MLFASRMPCAQCGASVSRVRTETHSCDPRRRVEFQMAALTSRLAAFEDDFRRYLAGNEGRFEVWLAERELRGGA